VSARHPAPAPRQFLNWPWCAALTTELPMHQHLILLPHLHHYESHHSSPFWASSQQNDRCQQGIARLLELERFWIILFSEKLTYSLFQLIFLRQSKLHSWDRFLGCPFYPLLLSLGTTGNVHISRSHWYTPLGQIHRVHIHMLTKIQESEKK